MRLVSWNVAGPDVAHLADETSEAQRARMAAKAGTLADEIAAEAPDIVALQETFDGDAGIAGVVARRLGMTLLGTKRSHCGEVAVMARARQGAHGAEVPTVFRSGDGEASEPWVGVDLGDVVFFGCHLAPFKEGEHERLQQLRQLVSARPASARHKTLIIAGDLNVREAEMSTICRELQLRAVKPPPRSYTWDSYVNPFRDGQFAFRCNFDRVLYRGTCTASDYRLLGTAPSGPGGPKAFLSDHFGISVRLDLAHERIAAPPLTSFTAAALAAAPASPKPDDERGPLVRKRRLDPSGGGL